MRTTLTLDDDVADKLKTFVRRKNVSFKEAVNLLLRRGLVAPEQRQSRKAGPQFEVFHSPFRAGVDPLKLNQMVDEIEVDAFGAKFPR